MINLFMTGSPLWQNEADPSYVLMGEIGLFCQLRFPTLFSQEKNINFVSEDYYRTGCQDVSQGQQQS